MAIGKNQKTSLFIIWGWITCILIAIALIVGAINYINTQHVVKSQMEAGATIKQIANSTVEYFGLFWLTIDNALMLLFALIAVAIFITFIFSFRAFAVLNNRIKTLENALYNATDEYDEPSERENDVDSNRLETDTPKEETDAEILEVEDAIDEIETPVEEETSILPETDKEQSCISSYNSDIQIAISNTDIAAKTTALQDIAQNIENDHIIDKDQKNSLLYQTYSNLVQAYTNNQDTEKSVETYSKLIELDPNYTEAYYNRGTTLSCIGQYEKAIGDFDQVLHLEPDNTGALACRADMYFKTNQFTLAADDYNQLIINHKAGVEVYKNLAKAHFKLEEYPQAIAGYDKVLELSPENEEVYLNRGLAYAHLKDYDAAIFNFNELLRLSPENADGYFNRGNAQTNKQAYETAINDYTEAIRFNPQLAEAYFNRGNIYYNNNEYSIAIEDYNKAIGLNTNYTKAYFNRGLAYKVTAVYQQGLDDFMKIISLDPDNKRLIEKVQKQIDQINKLIKTQSSDNLEQ